MMALINFKIKLDCTFDDKKKIAPCIRPYKNQF